jgi:hypothetical protein
MALSFQLRRGSVRPPTRLAVTSAAVISKKLQVRLDVQTTSTMTDPARATPIAAI